MGVFVNHAHKIYVTSSVHTLSVHFQHFLSKEKRLIDRLLQFCIKNSCSNF